MFEAEKLTDLLTVHENLFRAWIVHLVIFLSLPKKKKQKQKKTNKKKQKKKKQQTQTKQTETTQKTPHAYNDKNQT